MRTNSAPRSGLFTALASIAVGTATLAATPRIENARIVPRDLSSGLASTVSDLARGETAWVAYRVPMLPGDHEMCCYDGQKPVSRVGCRLDGSSFTISSGDDRALPVVPGSRDLWVLLRVADRRVRQVRSFGGECPLDGGGALVHTLDGVDPASSVELLHGLAREAGEDERRDGAITAIAFHAAEPAGRALLRFTAADSPEALRAKAAFWLGVTRGVESLDHLRAMVRADPSREVRQQAVFAISASDAPGSEAILIDLARRDSRPDVRSTALFWLSQEAGERVEDTLRAAVDDDPDVEVKEQAVFALSQLPPERGLPLLIDVARSSSRHPAVRRAAMFWLGQSGDPRALEFFEEVLAGAGDR